MTTKEQLVHFWTTKNFSLRLVEAFKQVPRENFVPPGLKAQAYEDQPLPTLRKQSISQPTTIMLMLQALEPREGEKIFEVGAGVGYQAAILSQIVGKKGKVISAEVIPELVQAARQNIAELGIGNVQIMEADGGEGLKEESPFDRIIITAACPTIPQPLIDQLKEGGVVVAPVGDLTSQTMIRGTKTGQKLELEFLGSFAFVPMKGRHGFEEAEFEEAEIV